MRRPAKAALTIVLATCAALALQVGVASAAPTSGKGGRVVVFTRGAAFTPSTSTRVWSVFRGTLGDVTDEGDGSDQQIPVLPTSLPSDSYGRLALLHAAGVATDADTLAGALDELELPFMFAGREQWVLNLTTPDGAASDPRLWNVSMESPVHDQNSMRILLGRAAWAVSERRSMADDVSYWQSLVPTWAPKVRDELAAQGIPFSVELLASPDVEVMDGGEPLFPRNAHPVSLFQLGSYEAGENAFLRSLSSQELMSSIYPMYYRIHHRPAGAPIPDELMPGLTFGNVIRESCSEDTANGCIDGVRYRHSPVMDTDAYQRWVAYGTPGYPERNGYILDWQTGWGYNPLTGAFFKAEDPGNANRGQWLSWFQTGAIKPGYFSSPWSEVVMNGLNSPISAAGFLQDPSIWFQGPRAKFAPDKLDSDTKARYLALETEK
jgi:hypothetical protein